MLFFGNVTSTIRLKIEEQIISGIFPMNFTVPYTSVFWWRLLQVKEKNWKILFTLWGINNLN